MQNREELYIQFGPKLIEAINEALQDEIELLKSRLNVLEGKSLQIVPHPYTKKELWLKKIKEKINNLEDYSWMNKPISMQPMKPRSFKMKQKPTP